MSKIERRAAKRAAKVARVSVSSSVQERGENERRSIVEVSPTSSRVSKRKKKKKKKKAKQTSNVDRIKEGEEEKGKCACQDATKRSDVLSARAVELFERENAKGTLSDRLNPKHPFFDAELKAAWKTELSKKERAEIVRRDQEKLTAELSRVSSIVHAFQTNIEDHCESPFEAYEDIAPVLRLIAKKLGKSPEELRIYDPYYCAGSVTRHMKKLGFCDVYNRNEDFYKVCREKRVPRHDVVVTNPPYSDNHVKRLLRFCRSNAKPFLLLLPNYFCVKEFYHETLLIGQNSSSTTRAKFEEPSIQTMKIISSLLLVLLGSPLLANLVEAHEPIVGDSHDHDHHRHEHGLAFSCGTKEPEDIDHVPTRRMLHKIRSVLGNEEHDPIQMRHRKLPHVRTETVYHRKLGISSVTIPVVMHAIRDEQCANGAEFCDCTDATLLEEATNPDPGTYLSHARAESEISRLNSEYPNTIRFEMAEYVATCSSSFFYQGCGHFGEMAMKNALHRDVSQFLNLYYLDCMSHGLYGIATFPPGLHGYEMDAAQGAMNDYRTAGGAHHPNFSGHTAVHEVGHYLGLYHTFHAGCSGHGDAVDDTPPVAEPNQDCPQNPSPAPPTVDEMEAFCSETLPDNHIELRCNACRRDEPSQPWNEMDYTPDSCKGGFTNGQGVRMLYMLVTHRPGLFGGWDAITENVNDCMPGHYNANYENSNELAICAACPRNTYGHALNCSGGIDDCCAPCPSGSISSAVGAIDKDVCESCHADRTANCEARVENGDVDCTNAQDYFDCQTTCGCGCESGEVARLVLSETEERTPRSETVLHLNRVRMDGVFESTGTYDVPDEQTLRFCATSQNILFFQWNHDQFAPSSSTLRIERNPPNFDDVLVAETNLLSADVSAKPIRFRDTNVVEAGDCVPGGCFGYSCNEWVHHLAPTWAESPYTCGVIENDLGCDCTGCCSEDVTPGKSCIDTDGDATDADGWKCDLYDAYPEYCAYAALMDDDDFTSSTMCCSCGGGSALDDGTCHDTNNGAADAFGHDCSFYDTSPSACAAGDMFDDDDFTLTEMCCACGGGSTTPTPTPAPTPTPPSDGTCHDTNNGATDAFDDDCSFYDASPSACVAGDVFDDDDFTLIEMCCACGGGAAPVAPTPTPPPEPQTGSVSVEVVLQDMNNVYVDAHVHDVSANVSNAVCDAVSAEAVSGEYISGANVLACEFSTCYKTGNLNEWTCEVKVTIDAPHELALSTYLKSDDFELMLASLLSSMLNTNAYNGDSLQVQASIVDSSDDGGLMKNPLLLALIGCGVFAIIAAVALSVWLHTRSSRNGTIVIKQKEYPQAFGSSTPHGGPVEGLPMQNL
eukprot:g2921.t1